MTITEPRTDRPAMADPTTAALFRAHRRDGIVLVCAGLLLPLCGWFMLSLDDGGYSTPLMLGFGVLGLVIAARVRLWVRWLRPGGQLLRAEAWRPVAARVARAGRPWWNSDVRLDDGTALRVTELTAAHHALIARTGRVWVVGPDDSGWAALRVDGVRNALPAQRIRGAVGQPPVAGDVTALAAAQLRARSFVPVWILVGWVPWTAWWIASSGSWSIIGSLIGWAVVVFGTRERLLDRHLPAFVAGAEWTPLEVTLKPWGVGQGGHTRADGRVWFADGTSSPLSMPNASVDLLAAAHEAESLWFSERPEPGKTLAVGFPGYPLLAIAKVSSVRT
ncbi:hypothetical protein SAMN05192558_103187 [Actinokineospora alba]|uniref:Uncharacterized protein n=1 Tax=Actinokineospora alba TaxID=504798 RepID=A0A1H0JSH4_9PSEU|nr:hypothetical protein [Actinokineospora alba]TDP68191.1 hypothetical protein C8E96_3755 [Actinokineospora alba]SDH93923.1 hypothetical protein SAMN05421871_102862 [Actinokineospora alba]SDO46361.1 hypothetical protein SAMN05192558_103187 [Actinokineospora alba]